MPTSSSIPLILLLAALPFACRTPHSQNASVKVTNGLDGTPTPDIRALGVGDGSICTGTFVNPSTLLTAAHCVSPGVAGGGVLLDGVKSVNYFINPAYFALLATQASQATDDLFEKDAEVGERLPFYDLAVVVFPPGTATALGVGAFRGIRARPAQDGESVFVLGFGDNDWTTRAGAGVFRWGTNTVHRAGAQHIAVKGVLKASGATGEGVAASPGHGDSGGPLIAQSQELLGTVSTGGPSRDHAVAVYVSLTSPASRALFQRAVACGYPPCAENFAGSGVDGAGNGGNEGQTFDGNGYDGKVPAGTRCLSAGEGVTLVLLRLAAREGQVLLARQNADVARLDGRARSHGVCSGDAAPQGKSCVAGGELKALLSQLDELPPAAAKAERAALIKRKATHGLCP